MKNESNKLNWDKSAIAKSLIDRGYQIAEEIGHRSFCVVFKAIESKSSRFVSLKLLRRDACGYGDAAILKLKQESEVLSKFALPCIAEVTALGELDEGIYVATEYVEGIDLKTYRGQGNRLELRKAIFVLTKVLACLGHLHSKGLIHGNLKPSNIMIGRADDSLEIKILDFGLQSLFDYSNLGDSGDFIDTIPYISPEQTGILRIPVDHRSDLYAVGVILYELITGRRPFDDADLNMVLHQHVASAPVSPREIVPDIPKEVEDVIFKLLRKEPNERYSDVNSLLVDLNNAMKGLNGFYKSETSGFPQIESVEFVRFRTRQIGRGDENRLLQQKVEKCSRGKEKLVLVSGPAGIGKTRLIETLREFLLSKEGLFLTGKSNEYDEMAPYGPIQEALEDLCNRVPYLLPGQQERFLGSLSSMESGHIDALVRFVPKFSDLIDRKEAGIEIDPERGKERFFETFFALLTKISKPRHPVVLFLDDLQWTDEGTVELIRRMAERLGEASVMILGAFRDDAIGKRHPLQSLISAVQNKKVHGTHLKLNPLNPIEVEQMVGEMLRGGEGVDDILLKEILVRGEGNPFFISEMIKSMTEASAIHLREGRWTCNKEWIDQLGVTPNIIDIIIKRLDKLSKEQMNVLIIASIIGMKFGSDMIFCLTECKEDVVIDILNQAVRMQIIKPVGDGSREAYKFYHDKIREALYLKSPSKVRRSLHMRIARQIESREEERYERIYELAYHYHEAGDTQKSFIYAIEAGCLARDRFAYKEALRYFERAWKLLDKIPTSDFLKERYLLLEALGDVYSVLGDYNKATRFFEERLSLGNVNNLERASLERRIGWTYFRKGAHKEPIEHLESALKILGRRVYQSRFLIWGEILLRFIHHLIRRAFHLSPVHISGGGFIDNPYHQELAYIYRDLTYVYVFSGTEKAMATLFRFLSQAEGLRNPYMLGDAYCLLAAMLYLGGMAWPSSWIRYMNESRMIRESLNDRWGLAQCKSFSGMNHLYRGELGEAYSCCREGQKLLDEIGDRWEYETIFLHLCLIHIGRGEFSKAIECAKELEERALEQGNYRGFIIASLMMGWAYTYRLFSRICG